MSILFHELFFLRSGCNNCNSNKNCVISWSTPWGWFHPYNNKIIWMLTLTYKWHPSSMCQHCHDPSLRITTKAKIWKGASRECNPEITFVLLGVRESVREWTHTFPSGFPLWELDFRWTFEFLGSNLKGKNSLDWGLPYIIRKLLRHGCLKWFCIIHLNTYNTSYGRKKGRKLSVNLIPDH